MEWPPKELDPIRAKMFEWAAWYAGDRAQLEAVGQGYGTDSGTGVVGWATRVWRRFWGRRATDSTDPQIKVHVPLAGDIARASADSLFAEPPAITADKPEMPEELLGFDPDSATIPEGAPQEDGTILPNPEYLRLQALYVEHQAQLAICKATTDHLQKYLDDGLITTLAGAAETCAALGGVFLRATWDMTRQRVFATRVDADCAVPEFEWGRLVKVTFWRELPTKDGVLRHLEIHENTDINAPDDPAMPRTGDIEVHGVIRHQLWLGDKNDLGRQIPLTEHPSTAKLVPLLVNGDMIDTMTPGLDVVYIPNVTPNPLWRTNPAGANLGAPDIMGCEDHLDRLDHTRSSLLEELDLSKARIMVPEEWLKTNGPGMGQTFDSSRRVFTAIRTPANDGYKPELFQPDIRVDAHLRIEQQLVEDIIRSAGYNAMTFGEDEDSELTATEVNAKTARTRLTRSKKLRHWRPALITLLTKMLTIDVELGRQLRATNPSAEGWASEDVDPSLVNVVFPEAQQTPLDLANTVTLWASAQAASIWVRVKTIHPDWDDDQISEEVDRIRADLAMEMPALPSFDNRDQQAEEPAA